LTVEDSKAAFIDGLFYAWGLQDVEQAYRAASSLERLERDQALFQIQRLKSKVPFSLLAGMQREDENFAESVNLFWSAWNYLTSDNGEFMFPDLAPKALRELVGQAAIHRYRENPTEALSWIKSLPPELKIPASKASAI